LTGGKCRKGPLRLLAWARKKVASKRGEIRWAGKRGVNVFKILVRAVHEMAKVPDRLMKGKHRFHNEGGGSRITGIAGNIALTSLVLRDENGGGGF